MVHSITPAAIFTLTEGLDLGDEACVSCRIDGQGQIIGRDRINTTAADLQAHFAKGPARRVVVEASTHSPWVGRLIQRFGHQLIVANPRHVHLIANNQCKNDRNDAELLARLGRADPALLSPVTPRSEQQQNDLGLIRLRDSLIRARTKLINTQRSIAKSAGAKLPACSADSFHRKITAAVMPAALWAILEPGIKAVEALSGQLKACDQTLNTICRGRYPQALRLQQIPGVGPVVALAFVLTVGDPARFARSREVAPFLGLVPRQQQSGEHDPQLSITKCGNTYMRCLLVNAAQRILQKVTPDCDLKRHGLHIYQAQGETRIAKRKAVVAVARKLAVVMHRVWVSGEPYVLCRNAQTVSKTAAAV